MSSSYDHAPQPYGRSMSAYASLRDEAMSLGELENLRLLLRGGSAIDWYRLNFERLDEVDAFTRLHGFDFDDELDRQHIEALRRGAAEYLGRVHGYKIPAELLSCDPRELALYASEALGQRRHRMFSCILLKVMHIVHHLEARELRYRLRISDEAVSRLLINKVNACAAKMRQLGFPVLDFSGGQKQRDSLIAKLLVKRENLAVEVFDRVRFRFVLAEARDLVPTLRFLMQEVIPFNYLIPSQTQNDLIDFTALLRSHPLYRTYEARLQTDIGLEDAPPPMDGARNEFSGATYRVINFVADVPLRVPDEVLTTELQPAELGRVIFAVAEFQILDAATARQNDRGENAHHRYKARQRGRERERLERGTRSKLGRGLF